MRYLFATLAALLFLPPATGQAGDAPADPRRGFDLLTNKAYVAPGFDDETFDQLWKSWEQPLRAWAENATPAQRRTMAFRRYGFTARPGDSRGRPLQYVVDDAGQWTLNCLACHQGTVAGTVVPGAANTRLALETLTEDVRKTKWRLGKPLTDMDLGSLVMPLGTTVGTTNAVMFGVALFSFRDEHLNLKLNRERPPMTHHDLDAPPWWNVARKERLYCDGFAPRGHRMLMQFIATKDNGPEKFRHWEGDFRHIEAYINSLETPKYPFAVDHRLADEGRIAFNRVCADCHGQYGPTADQRSPYPEQIVPIEELRTDPVRLQSLTLEGRRNHERSWLNEYGGKGAVVADPGGYLAPPLDGVWASAPYLHNGSVPTLWHVLHPGSRPTVWARKDNPNDPAGLTHSAADALALDFDAERGGLAVDEFDELPAAIASAADRRRYFDTRSFGKSAAGHDFPEALDKRERKAVLEYLKTL